jgi:hypothetical protein
MLMEEDGWKDELGLLVPRVWGSPCIYIAEAEAMRDEQSCRQEESHPLISI